MDSERGPSPTKGSCALEVDEEMERRDRLGGGGGGSANSAYRVGDESLA